MLEEVQSRLKYSYSKNLDDSQLQKEIKDNKDEER